MKMKKINFMVVLIILTTIFVLYGCKKKGIEFLGVHSEQTIRYEKKGIELLKVHEGFRGLPYKCSEGYNTIGYGTLLPLSEEEAELLLIYRLKKIDESLKSIEFYKDLPIEIQNVLINMTYNLGISGLLKFKKTLFYLEHKKYKKASKEMLNSRWANQVKNRAIELSNIVAACE